MPQCWVTRTAPLTVRAPTQFCVACDIGLGCKWPAIVEIVRSQMNSGALSDRLRAVLSDLQPAEQKMFGGVCFMLNGNMVAGTLGSELLVRVGKRGKEAALRRPHARPMNHMGRPVAGYVIVAGNGTNREKDLKDWVGLAVADVTTCRRRGTKRRRSRQPRTPSRGRGREMTASSSRRCYIAPTFAIGVAWHLTVFNDRY